MPTRDFFRRFPPLLAVAAALPALLFTLDRVHAAPVVVDGRTIELPLPAGYCAIDRDRSPDAQAWEALRAAQEPHNHVLAWFTSCDELERWRADPQAFDHHGMVLAPAAPPVRSRAEYIAAVVQDLEQGEGEPAAGATAPRQGPGEAPPLHLLERGDDGVLATTVFAVDTPAGQRRVVSVIAFTAIGGTRLSADFYGPDTGPEALRPVRDTADAYLASLIAANPEPRAGVAWRIAAGVAVLAAAAGAVFYWLKRHRGAA
jgi:hypothetical protein